MQGGYDYRLALYSNRLWIDKDGNYAQADALMGC